MMNIGIGMLAFISIWGTLSYHRAFLSVWAVSFALFLILLESINHVTTGFFIISWLVFFLVVLLFSADHLRRKFFTRFVLSAYKKTMPSMSATEREALSAGTVGWEGELFSGYPDWGKLLALPKAILSFEEEAFLAGPVETLCAMIDDWDITHYRADLPPEIWQFLKNQGFFALIIPKEYGGKAFSAYAHSEILTKVYGRSTTVASTIAVPNSLGPAELILHYGTPEQKNYYLPRLASGEEIPCFALTGPEAGSDAGAMTDRGVVCWGEHAGKAVLGIRLNWNKRYITLAPVATLIGLAFKLEDPDHLLSEKTHLGITCALISHTTPGVTRGRRHFPCNIAFQNGPTQGKNVFIPLAWIIGGVERAGQGWRMLMECLAAGRAISLPASAIGGGKVIAYTAGAYARIRKQFNVPIGCFEGIEEIIARMMGLIYIMDATRTFTANIIDQGERPAVASAITKYHVTELGRIVTNDAMDLHGGKAICLGPRNYLGRYYQSIPIGITVEGANILTRSMIIFGQGAIRCHPYVFAEFEAAALPDGAKSLEAFDESFLKHLGFFMSNFFRTLFLSLTAGRLVSAPAIKTKRYFQQLTRFSAGFALLTDVSLFYLGGSLKRKENISSRLGDILSYLYLLSAVLKHYEDQEHLLEDFTIVQWSGQYCLYQIQQKMSELLTNFPNLFLRGFLKMLIFPFGKNFYLPSDVLNHTVTQLFMAPTTTRARLAKGAFIHNVGGNILAIIEDALHKVIAAEPIEKILKDLLRKKLIQGTTLFEQAQHAFAQQIISQADLDKIIVAEQARSEVIAVDDFAPEELAPLDRGKK